MVSGSVVVALLAAVVLLSGCGYHLRGAVELPPEMERTYIRSGKLERKMTRVIAEALERSGVGVVEHAKQATAVLVVSNVRSERRILSVDSAGRAQEYELKSGFSFELRSPEGAVLVPLQKIDVQRDFLFNPDSVLSKGHEERQLRDNMNSDLVRTLLQRLRFRSEVSETE